MLLSCKCSRGPVIPREARPSRVLPGAAVTVRVCDEYEDRHKRVSEVARAEMGLTFDASNSFGGLGSELSTGLGSRHSPFSAAGLSKNPLRHVFLG